MTVFYKLTVISSLIFSFQLSAQAQSSILYMGDSQSAGYLGYYVHQHLKQKKDYKKISVYGVSSSSPRHWGTAADNENSQWLCTRKGRYNDQINIPLKNIICAKKGDSSVFKKINEDKTGFIVFQFLGNSMGLSEQKITTYLTELLDGLHPGQDCLFITSPPVFIDLVDFNKKRIRTENIFVNVIGSRCEIVRGMNSQNMKNFATQRDHFGGDQKHLSKKGARVFFNQFKTLLNSN